MARSVAARPRKSCSVRREIMDQPKSQVAVDRDAVMLVDDQVKRFLAAIPLASFQNRRTFAAATDDFYPLDFIFRFRAGKIVGKPIDFVAAPDQFAHEVNGLGRTTAGRRKEGFVREEGEAQRVWHGARFEVRGSRFKV